MRESHWTGRWVGRWVGAGPLGRPASRSWVALVALLLAAQVACGDDDEAPPPSPPSSCPGGCGGGGAGGSPTEDALACLTAYGDAGIQRVDGVATDGNGNIYVSGYFAGSIDVGATPLASPGGFDGFVAKLDAACDGVWAFRLGQALPLLPEGAGLRVAVGVDDLPVVAGEVFGDAVTVSLDGTALERSGLQPDLFAVKLDKSGALIWAQHFALLANRGSVRGIGFDRLGNAFLVGDVDGGAGTLVSAGLSGAGVFVLGLAAADGASVLEKVLPHDRPGMRAAGVIVDADGALVVAGDFTGSLTVDDETLAAEGGADLFVVKLDALGERLWTRRYGDGAEQLAAGIVADADGNAYVAGAFNGAIDFGVGDPFPAFGDDRLDAVVFKLTPDGEAAWVRAPAAEGLQAIASVARDSDGHVVAGGVFEGTLELADGLQAEDRDGFVVTIDGDGALVWAHAVGGPGDHAIGAVAGSPDPPGAVVFGGALGADLAGPEGAVVHRGDGDAMIGKLAPKR